MTENLFYAESAARSDKLDEGRWKHKAKRPALRRGPMKPKDMYAAWGRIMTKAPAQGRCE